MGRDHWLVVYREGKGVNDRVRQLGDFLCRTGRKRVRTKSTRLNERIWKRLMEMRDNCREGEF